MVLSTFLGIEYDTVWIILGITVVAAAIVAVVGLFMGNMEAGAEGQAHLAIERDLRNLRVVEVGTGVLVLVQHLLGRSLNEQEREVAERAVGFSRVSLNGQLPTRQQLAQLLGPEEAEHAEEHAEEHVEGEAAAAH